MERRPLGRTGVQVSALGFGAGAIGGLLVRGDAAGQRRAVARALDAGVTYFDTAPSYGDGRSEENLGRVLRDLHARNRVVVGTKVRLQPGDLREPAPAVLRSIEGSLRRLGRETVDLVQLHNPITGSAHGDPDVPAGSATLSLDAVLSRVAEGMQRIVRQGLARHIGITGLGDTTALDAVVAAGTFETVQSYFNALNPSAGFPGASGGAQDFGGLIDRAAGAGMGVIVIRAMAAGALSATPARHPNAGDPSAMLVSGAGYDRDLERARALASLATDLGLEGPLELALRFALAKAGISTVLVGYSDPAQLEDALRWTGRGPLAEEAVSRIAGIARQTVAR